MSATKLLVLGVVRMLQPVHGYVVRRELLSWSVDEWASVNPGSIYGALRTLAKGGFVVETETQTDAEGGRPARTTYRMTEDGEVEFFQLFRQNLWRNVGSSDIAGFRAALSFMWVVTRDEILQAMEHRLHQLDGSIKELTFSREQLLAIPEKPDQVVELLHLEEAMLRGQIEWTRAFMQRVGDGAYAFAGEPDVGAPWHDQLAERGVVASVPEHDAPLR
ncbi:MAG TPA: PadR family transcriptional regulator [Euzebyales bacterium]|nr:PadR family transcriptional regulator [Euzebyales bacterium]